MIIYSAKEHGSVSLRAVTVGIGDSNMFFSPSTLSPKIIIKHGFFLLFFLWYSLQKSLVAISTVLIKLKFTTFLLLWPSMFSTDVIQH